VLGSLMAFISVSAAAVTFPFMQVCSLRCPARSQLRPGRMACSRPYAHAYCNGATCQPAAALSRPFSRHCSSPTEPQPRFPLQLPPYPHPSLYPRAYPHPS
jgi:hypothetical protein